MADKKISQLTAKGSRIVASDRVPIAQDDGAGAFSTKYVTGAEINEVLLDTTPQLGGNLDVNGNKISSASNGNIKIEPNGTGAVLIGGNDTQPTELRFMELLSNGSSYVGFKAPDDIVTNKVYTLPLVDGTSGQFLSTNGSAVMSWSTGASYTPRVQTVASAATVTPTSTNDLVTITAQAAALALANPTGTWDEGQPLMIRIKDNGTARAITYGSDYRAIGVTLPTTTVISKTTYLGIIYNSTDTKWDVISVTTQA